MLDRAVAVLRSLADGETESTAGEIARAVGLHKSTVHRLLMVLEHHRLVQKSPGGYQLGTGLLELGEKASARLRLSERAGPYLRELSAHTGEGAHVTVISDTDMLAIAHVEGRWNLQPLTRTGSRTQIHCTAAGKAVLAFLSTEACDGIIARLSFPRLTRRTIVTPAAFKLELMRVRDAGYAMDDEEFEDGLRCVGAPVFDHRGHVVASLSLAAPSSASAVIASRRSCGWSSTPRGACPWRSGIRNPGCRRRALGALSPSVRAVGSAESARPAPRSGPAGLRCTTFPSRSGLPALHERRVAGPSVPDDDDRGGGRPDHGSERQRPVPVDRRRGSWPRAPR